MNFLIRMCGKTTFLGFVPIETFVLIFTHFELYKNSKFRFDGKHFPIHFVRDSLKYSKNKNQIILMKIFRKKKCS